MAEVNGASELAEVRQVLNSDYREQLGSRVRGNVTGAAVGLAGGLFYGMAKRKNIYITSLIGMLIGGTASYLVTSNKK